MVRKWIAALLFSATLFVTRLSAQTGTGTISGTVQDSAGAVFVSAKIEIQPVGRQTTTDDQGLFRISNLPAGQYTVKASYVGFQPYEVSVSVAAGQTTNVSVKLQVASEADTVMVTAPRLQGDAEAVNVERMSAEIVQVEPAGVITSLPNNNIADAVGRLPSVSLERDEGEGKYVQIRGTEPRLSNVTINGINVPAPEVTVRNIKLDAVPSDVVERIEVYKTLAADQDADAIGGTVNLVTKTAQDKSTYALSGTAGYNPLQTGYWRGGFDGTFGQRFGTNKNFGFLLGGTWDRTNRGIDDLEPSQTTGTVNGQNIAYINSEDLRSYTYYRTRYGFDLGVDDRITPTVTAYLKGLFADFHDFGEAWVYTPNAGALTGINGNQLNFDNTGNWQYRHYIRRPDQQVFSFLAGARHDLKSDTIIYEFAASRGHNIGGQSFPTTYFNGPTGVTFTQDNSDPYRPRLFATDGINGFDATQYGVSETDFYTYHATQLNYEGDASLAHNYTVNGHPSTFSIGTRIRNSYSTQRKTNNRYTPNGASPFLLSDVVGGYTNPTYYNKTFAIQGRAYGPASSYRKMLNAFQTNSSAFTLDTVNATTAEAEAFFNADENISAGYIQDVIYFGKFRLQGGLRFDNGSTHFLANNVTANQDSQGNPIQPTVTPVRQDASYFNVLPSVALQYQFQLNSNLRVVYGRGVARPNIGDLVPATVVDPNSTPYPTISTGNPSLKPTKGNSLDVLVEHFFQPLGILQAGYFYKQLSDPIYPVATLIPDYNNTGKTYQETQSINGPNASIQGFEAEWEQRFSFLPGGLRGFGVNANYSYTTSRVTFPANFDSGRTDHPNLDRMAPNNYNFNLTYDLGRFSSRFAISHNDANIAAYQWTASTGPANDPILGLKGPTGDNYFYAHTQFDVQGSYRLYKNLQVTASGLNLSNEVFGFYNGSGIYPVQREYYRPTVSFGLRWKVSGE
jgi:TonB-dependent receptor